MTIDILCKAVDNYGDVGTAYRLAKALSDLPDPPRLRLLVDGLPSLARLAPELRPDLPVQGLGAWTVVRWDHPWEGYLRERPRLVVEVLESGRPHWFEELLFDPADGEVRRIAALEYLTAETLAEELHGMASLTRSALVKKRFFMPGFGELTGGLAADRAFLAALGRWDAAFRDRAALARARRAWADGVPGFRLEAGDEDRFWVLAFSYPRDQSRLAADLAAFSRKRPVLLVSAAGPSAPCVRMAWEAAGRPFPLAELPFLGQEAWDEAVLAADFAVVRGEESLSRAALSGRPFLWHAYLQDGRHQLVKVGAFLDRLRPRLAAAGAPAADLEALFRAFNDRAEDSPETAGEESFLPVLGSLDALEPAFRAFAEDLRTRTDLARRLLTFFSDMV